MDKKFVVEYTISGYPADAMNIMGKLIYSRLKGHQDFIDGNVTLAITPRLDPTSITVAVFPEELKAEIPAFLKDHTAFKTWWDVTLNTVNNFFGKEEK
jgi:hypothetical protein